jgi:hypothetical protein
MKSLVLPLLILIAQPLSAADLPAWLAGSWILKTEGQRVEEHWSTADGGLMVGMGKTVTPKRTSFEFFRIADVDGVLTYLAMPQARPETPFRMKSASSERIVFENLEHDFPQRVLYWRDGEKLCARIEGTLNGKLEGEDWCYARMK